MNAIFGLSRVMETRTTRCSSYGQREFLIRCDDSIPAPDVDWLVTLLENSVRDGQTYRDEDTLQVGWMLNRVSSAKAGSILLTEPDMISFPIKWIDGVTETLRQLRIQKDTAESLGLDAEMQIPTIRDSALVGVDFARDPENIVLERFEAVGNDSGWFIGYQNTRLDYNNPENLTRVSLYVAAVQCPTVIPFLFLPCGTRVDREGHKLEFSLNGKTIGPRPGSFLKRLFHI
ncbi:MAG TPA: hypothetical protein VHY91_00545 [Pirellulales bacterium]|nr:hypothetical protein [Pirellulales bacterium]